MEDLSKDFRPDKEISPEMRKLLNEEKFLAGERLEFRYSQFIIEDIVAILCKDVSAESAVYQIKERLLRTGYGNDISLD